MKTTSSFAHRVAPPLTALILVAASCTSAPPPSTEVENHAPAHVTLTERINTSEGLYMYISMAFGVLAGLTLAASLAWSLPGLLKAAGALFICMLFFGVLMIALKWLLITSAIIVAAAAVAALIAAGVTFYYKRRAAAGEAVVGAIEKAKTTGTTLVDLAKVEMADHAKAFVDGVQAKLGKKG